MPQQVVFVGNSHLAALWGAYSDAPQDWPGISVAAVGARVSELAHLRITPGGVLTGATDAARQAIERFNGTDRLALAPDAVLIIAGAQLALPRLLPILRSCAWLALPSIRARENAAMLDRTLMSRHAVVRAAEARLGTAAAVDLARRFSKTHAGPVLVASQPRTSEAVLGRPRAGLGHLQAPVHNGDAPQMSRLFEEAATRAVLAAGATYLPQPRRTITSGLLTKEAFALGAIKLSAGKTVPQEAGDLIHANKTYGAEVLTQITECLAA